MLAYACYHFLFLQFVLLLLRSIWKDSYTTLPHFIVLAGLGSFTAVLFAVLCGRIFDVSISLNLAVHGLAWHGTFFLFASALLMYRQKKSNGTPRRCFPTLVFIFGGIYFGVAANTLLFEPTALVIRETTITTPKITKPITIVFCSDMQAERIGSYERWTLQKIKEQNADLILFGGDYMQPRRGEWQKTLSGWNQLFQEVDLQAPLGIYAVQGNIDEGSKDIFANTAIVYQGETMSKSIGEIRVTFLAIQDSAVMSAVPDVEREDKFRIIVGHRPLFAMATQEADLLLAGHTHGGQVQIPFWGLPILTASGPLPRRWATGMTIMPNGTMLIVSHGTGLERSIAPRVRFWCRPDFWVIRLVPE